MKVDSNRIYDIIVIADRLKSTPHKRLTPNDIKNAHDTINELLLDGTVRPMVEDTLKAIEEFQTRRAKVTPTGLINKLALK